MQEREKGPKRKTDPESNQQDAKVTGISEAAIEGALEGEQEQTSSPDSTKPETSHAGMSDPRSRSGVRQDVETA